MELKLPSLCLLDGLSHLLSIEVQLIHNALHRLLTCNGILHTDSEPMDCKPLVDYILCTSEEVFCWLGPAIPPDDMYETLLRGARCSFVYITRDKFALVDDNHRICWGAPLSIGGLRWTFEVFDHVHIRDD